MIRETQNEDKDSVGGHEPTRDWLGAKLHKGDWITYPSEGRGKGLDRTTTQMVLAEILELTVDGGALVQVLRRSRTIPTRLTQRLTPVGMRNVQRTAWHGDATSHGDAL